MTQTLRILQLYPRDMNIYGDRGNTLTLQRRAEWRNISVELLSHNPGDNLPEDVDIIVGGGGQDSGQLRITEDLQRIAPKLHKLAKDGTPMLMICGLYQLFGKSFTTRDGEVIKGISLLPVETVAGNERLIGNIVTRSDQFGEIIGYENHSGQTKIIGGGKPFGFVIKGGGKPFGFVIKGAGNNGHDETEGVRHYNVIGTYLHGSLLPKNPLVADWLIETALKNKYGDNVSLQTLDDNLADKARTSAASRPR